MSGNKMAVIRRVRETSTHPNADNLEIVIFDGWQVVVVKNIVDVGDLVLHISPEAMVLKQLADDWSVTKYLSWRGDGKRGRTSAIRLRGQYSYGFIVPVPCTTLKEGTELDDELKIEKYESPVTPFLQEEAESPHILFPNHPRIENINNYPDIFSPGEKVWVTEKIHGVSSRVGMIKDDKEWIMMVGSHAHRRKLDKAGIYKHPLSIPGVSKVLEDCAKYGKIAEHSFVLYGEIYGKGVQHLDYGIPKDEKGYRVFDISIDGKFMDFHDVCDFCYDFKIKTVPSEFRPIPFDIDFFRRIAEHESTIYDGIREGFVIRSETEESDLNIGRRMLKLFAGRYMTSKGRTERH